MPAGSVGDLCIYGIKWEGSGDVTGISGDVNGTYTMRTEVTHGNGDLHCRFAYKVATGTSSETVTSTTSGTCTFPDAFCLRASASGTIAYDTEANGSGTSTSVASGTFTTATVNGLTCALYGAYSSATLTVPKIGANTGITYPAAQPAEHSWAWSFQNTAQYSGATATATLSGSNPWIITTISVKAQ
jgi:hypothetical protein